MVLETRGLELRGTGCRVSAVFAMRDQRVPVGSLSAADKTLNPKP